MTNPNFEKLPNICFSQIYKQNIQPKLEAIDIFLKSTPEPYDLSDVSVLLHIDLDDLKAIIETYNIQSLNIISFFTIVQTASSYICKLIQREWACNAKHYTPESIAYIYELNLDKVQLAFERSGLSQVHSHNIQDLFKYIYVPVMNM